MEGGAIPTPEKQSGYTPYNAGSGMVNALRSVEFAEDGSVPTYDQIYLANEGELEFLSAAGSRLDDGQLFTGGQTNTVDIEITDLSHDVVEAREILPEGWTVVGTGDDVTASADGTTVTFDTNAVNQATGSGSASFTYFVEAPNEAQGTGSYTFGPVEVRSIATDDPDDAFVGVSGTSSTELVVGQSTNL